VEVYFYSPYTPSWCGQEQFYRFTFHRSFHTAEQYIKHVIFNAGLPSISFDAVLASYLVGSPAEVSLHKCKAGPSFK
jgi:hypothetical protein